MRAFRPFIIFLFYFSFFFSRREITKTTFLGLISVFSCNNCRDIKRQEIGNLLLTESYRGRAIYKLVTKR